MITTKVRKTLSTHAAAAKMIRMELKRLWPQTTFRVKSDTYSGGDAVRVHWIDGPTSNEVEKIIDDYQYGGFNGMIDLYEYTNERKELPQVKYVQTQRGQSPETFSAIVAWLNRYYGYALEVDPRYGGGSVTRESDQPMSNGYGYQSHEIHRVFHETSLVCPSCKASVIFGDTFCSACGCAQRV